MSDIQVGDEVYKRLSNGNFSAETYTVLYVHNEDPRRKWYVVSFKGDIPTAHYEKDLKKEPIVFERRFSTFFEGKCNYWKVTVTDGVPDWSTVKENE